MVDLEGDRQNMKPSKMKTARFNLSMSQTVLADLTGIWQGRISHIENGLTPTKAESELIGAILGVDPAKLFKIIGK